MPRFRFSTRPSATWTIDITKSSPPNELLRIMSEIAGDQTSFLAVDDPLFEREEVLLSSLSDVQVCAPKRHFDAFVVMPQAHLIQGSATAARTEAGGLR